MIEDFIIDALVTIGNAKKVMETCEPNIMESMKLKPWMVLRTLKALELLENEQERLSENTGGEIQETPISDEGSIHSHP